MNNNNGTVHIMFAQRFMISLQRFGHTRWTSAAVWIFDIGLDDLINRATQRDFGTR